MDISSSMRQYIGFRRNSSNGHYSNLFPMDGGQNVQKVISHPASKQLWRIIQANQEKKILPKKILDHYKQLVEMSICEVEKSVCAKIVKNGETIVECFECRVDESCIICMDCFKNGNHKGHRVVFKKAGGGCCDCGDTQAWKQQGFCTKHNGKEKQIIIEEKQIRNSNQMLLQLYYFYSFLKISDSKIFPEFFEGFFALLTEMVNQGLKGMKLVANLLNNQLPKKLSVSSKLNGRILQQLFNIQFSRADFRRWQNLFIQMFPNYSFKQQLISTYMKTYSSLYANQMQTGLSLSCQIITSYKLVEDYADSAGAVPILVTPSQNINQIQHLSKMFIYDLDRITSLQGNASIKYWKMQIKYGVSRIFAYYQSLKMLARKQKQRGQIAMKAKVREEDNKQKTFQNNSKKIKSKRISSPSSPSSEQSESDNEDKRFSLVQFLKRYNRIIQMEHSFLEQFLHIVPLLVCDQGVVNTLIKDLVDLIRKQVTAKDDLLIFRPYQRMLTLLLFYLSKQTPFLLTGEAIRTKVRESSGLDENKWSLFLNDFNQRMTQTLAFYSYIQTHENQNYHHTFYVYIMLYCSSTCLLGFIDILAIKQIILLGADYLTFDFKNLAKIKFYEPEEQKWSFKMISNLVTQLNLVNTGHFAEIYISHLSLKSQIPTWISQETKVLLRKFISSLGGASSLEKIQIFCNSFVTSDQEKAKNYLKQLCIFNKQKKIFELLPNQVDKNDPINFKDFGLRVKDFNQSSQQLPPSSTLQFINNENKSVLTAIWNKSNIDALCSLLLQILDQVQNKKSKDQLVAFYAIPCRISAFLKHAQANPSNYTSLTQMLQNLEVSAQIRKVLGPLANQLPSVAENTQLSGQEAFAQKQLQKQKKLKKLEELKKKNTENLSKIKEIHKLAQEENQANLQQCVICRKSGGNLVWVSRLGIKNIQRIYGEGEGALTLSFTTCYHSFDYECIVQNAIKRSTHPVLFRCPVCRTLGNVLININLIHQSEQSQVYIDAILDRILQVTMTLRNYRQFNIIQELLKGFYHYVLLGYLEPHYVQRKRLKLYQRIVTLLIHLKDQQKIDSAVKNFEQHRIVLRPKVVAQEKRKIMLKEVEVGEMQSDSEEDMSEEGMELWMSNIHRDHKTKEHVQGQTTKKIKLEDRLEVQQQYSSIFYYTLKRITDHIRAERSRIQEQKTMHEEILGKMSIPQAENKRGFQVMESKQAPDWVIYLLDQLLEEKDKMQVQWKAPQLVKIISLPEKYDWDMSQNKCESCSNTCSDIFLCMLCKWKGCLNSCRKGGIKRHNKHNHGENGAFLRLKEAMVYVMNPGQIRKVGCLYLNEWGQDFNIKNNWNQYYLQPSVIEQTIGVLIKDE